MIVQSFENPRNAWRHADFMAHAGIKCKLWKEQGKWWTAY